MKKTFKPLRNNSGQLTMELVLLIALGIGVFSFVRQGIGSIAPLKRAFGTNVPGSPWDRIRAMAEYGVWVDVSNQSPLNEAKQKHPNTAYRYLSSETQ